MTANILFFEQVLFKYNDSAQPALDRFSLSIPAGSVSAVLGPNGAGKTTMLHLALGWLRPQQGQILLNGNPMSNFTRREVGQWIGLVPQSEHIPYEFSLLEYALLGRAPHLKQLELPGREDALLVSDILKQLGLGPLEHKPVIYMSGGERQMAMIARAMAQQPRLLLLDEPTAHLDIGNKSRLIELLRELTQKGITILLTTHEPEFASAIATHLVLMKQGRVVEAGELSDVLTSRNLTHLYERPVEVLPHNGRQVVIWN